MKGPTNVSKSVCVGENSQPEYSSAFINVPSASLHWSESSLLGMNLQAKRN